MMNKRAVIYTRVSTDEQAERGSSLETQLKACREWADKHRYSIVAEIEDEFTGTSLDRPGFEEVMKLVDNGSTDALIVYSADRLSRNLVHRVIIRDELQKADVQLVYNNRGVIGYSPTDRFLDNMEGAVAEYEVELIRERMMRGKRAKAEKGIPVGHGHPPFGYKFVGKGDDTRFEIVEEEAEIVRLIFSLYKKGLRMTDIAEYLTDRRIPSKADRRNCYNKIREYGEWSRQMIHPILSNDVYTGIWYAFRLKREGKKVTKRPKKEWIPISVPSIISKSEWDEIQNKRKKNRGRKPKHKYLLSGRIRCFCGYAVCGNKNHNGYKTYIHYLCSARGRYNKLHKCSLPYFQERLVDDTVWGWIENILNDPKNILTGLQGLREETNRANKTNSDRISFLEKQILSLGNKIDRLLSLFLDETISKSVLDEKLVELETMKTKMESEINNLKSQMVNIPSDEEIIEITSMIKIVEDKLSNVRFDDKRHILELLDVNVTLSHENGERYIDMRCLIGENIVRIKNETSNDLR